ncbi:hypothetical protein BDY21DRAFT_417413 [Lineolata rhizophorae]|uniref:DUF7924 domain-containing protein n=1 Tax=Lineolata rhizophorae TaxID=578093 RepID=A0A6A6NP12_9PEZI|nr:hypothetical protein BDY21DRAFT_417413 [Lineolata rhizophorae]
MTTAATDPIGHWARRGTWPQRYFEQDDRVREDFNNGFEKEDQEARWLEQCRAPDTGRPPSDQRPREEKSAPYRTARYEAVLAAKGSFMDEDEGGVKEESKDLCRALEANRTEPTRFPDRLFNAVCRKIRGRNEAMVIQDIARLIVPSAQNLAIHKAGHLGLLIETVNEGWNNSLPLVGARPQPDYAVGFRREAFTAARLSKLGGLVGDVVAGDASFYMATYFMYLPFLTCEVKCGDAALDVADRQNAHSMTLAVRGVVDLFRRVGREGEVDREILAFSFSHDHSSVRIYGHYAVVRGDDTAFYRHPIRAFSFTERDGENKWAAYKFTKNVYDMWAPNHFRRLCSVIDELPPGHDWDGPPHSEGRGAEQ